MDTQETPGVHHELVDRVLGADGHAPRDLRQAAFDNSGPDDQRVRTLVEKVAARPTEITDADFATASEAGLTDDQLWEIIICAAIGQSTRMYEGALGTLDEVIKEESS